MKIAAQVLKFSRQAFYKWLAKPVSNRQSPEEEIICKIRQIHNDDPEFGYQFIADGLHGQGVTISEWHVWRLCSKIQVFSVSARRKPHGKKSGAPLHYDLLKRHFHADTANTAWVTDITEHWTGEGKRYLRAIKDLCAQKIVSYATGERMKSSLTVAALEDAMVKRGEPQSVIVHSDRCSQFASRKFRIALKVYGAKGCWEKVGECGDNAAMDSFFALVQKNVLDRKSCTSRRELSAANTHWIERTYHCKRRQLKLGKLTPNEYETTLKPAASLAA